MDDLDRVLAVIFLILLFCIQSYLSLRLITRVDSTDRKERFDSFLYSIVGMWPALGFTVLLFTKVVGG